MVRYLSDKLKLYIIRRRSTFSGEIMRKNSIKNRIYNYGRDKYYFNIREIRKHLNQHNIEYTDENVKKTLYRMHMDQLIFDAGKGWYSSIKEKYDLNKRPVEKYVNAIAKDLPFLEFSCWSTEQLKSFFHHLPSQFILFIFSDREFLSALKDHLETIEFDVFLNPSKAEVEKYVHFRGPSVILRPSITSREPKEGHFARIEKIIVDLYMESKKINLLDDEEYRRIVKNILHNFRIDLADMLEYAERRGIKSKIANFVRDCQIK